MTEETHRPIPSAGRGAARRHRVEGGRQHAVKIRLTKAEFDAIEARAADAHVSVQRFMVSNALTRRNPANAALAEELEALRRLTSNVANNVNQIARRLNSGGRPDGSVTAAADAATRTMSRLNDALAWLDAPPLPARNAAAPPSRQPPDQSSGPIRSATEDGERTAPGENRR
jgi:hypothetical protein